MERLKPTRPIPAASTVIIDEGRVLLIKRKAQPNCEFWAFPGGGIEVGELACDAAAREALEETGLVVEVGSLIDSFEVISPKGSMEPDYHYLILCFRARMIGGGLRASTDAEEAEWVPIHEALNRELTEGARAILTGIAMSE